VQPNIATHLTSMIKLGLAIGFIGIWFTPSCTYDRGEVIQPATPQELDFCDSIKAVDSTLVSYKCDVKPILDVECTLTCHTPTSVSGTPFLDSYDLVKVVANDGSLMGSINWTGTFTTMPFLSATKIDLVQRNTIQEWINQGTAP